MKTGRNEPCHCGSGKKFKNCHADKTPERAMSNRMGWIVTAVVAAGAVTLFASFRGSQEEPASTVPAAPITAAPAVTTPAAQPAGDPPPGKVWSTEHGHWHDATNPEQIQLSTTKTPASKTLPSELANLANPGAPQPPGPVPTGKVWSTEHGHWHDAPGTASGANGAIPPDLQKAMQPPGVPAPPPGAVWSEEHRHWHDAKEEAKRKGTVKPDAATTTQAPAPQNPK